MRWMSVREAAKTLGVSVRRVRQLVEQGALPASRIGNTWAIDSAAVDRRLDRAPPPGRPYSPRNSWRMAQLADAIVGDQEENWHLLELKNHLPSGRHAQERWHAIRDLRNLMAHGDLDVVTAMLRSRSRQVEHRYVHRSLLRRLSADPRLVISGAHAAENVGDLVADEHLEVYVKASDLLAIEDEYGLQSAEADRANVVLRLVEEDLSWTGRDAPLLLVAADLRERDDARAREASDELFRRLQKALESVR